MQRKAGGPGFEASGASALNIEDGLLMRGQEWNLDRARGSRNARCQSRDMCPDMTLSEGIASATPGPVRVGCVANKSGGDMRLMFCVSQCHASIRERTSFRRETGHSVSGDISPTVHRGLP